MENKKDTRKKIGLALGGGGAKGLAHIGVIKVLEDAGIPIDFIAGTSMGALIGGWYAATRDVYLLERIFTGASWEKVFSNKNFLGKENKKEISRRSQEVFNLIDEAVDDKKIEDCHIPFTAVATSVESGNETTINKGLLSQAIKASISIPFVFNPVEINKELLMDGGFANPVPADVVRSMGADIVIAVDVSSQWVKLNNDLITSKNLYVIASEALSAIEYQIAHKVLEKADVVLRPAVLSFDWLSFNLAEEIILEGKREAEKVVGQIGKLADVPMAKYFEKDDIISRIFKLISE